MTTDLNGGNAHVDTNLIFPYFFESSHGKTDVIEILNRSTEPLRQVGDEVKYALHLRTILLVAELSKVQLPSFDLGHQTNFQFLCKEESEYLLMKHVSKIGWVPENVGAWRCYYYLYKQKTSNQSIYIMKIYPK